MPEPLKATMYLKPMNGGGSRAQLVKASDGQSYVTKLIGNPQGTRILANEYFYGKISGLFDVPCPSVTTIEIDSVMMDNINRTCGTQFKAGIQFGQRYVDSAFPSNPDLMAKVGNLRKWPNAVLVDTLLQNEDVNDRHILIKVEPDGSGSNFWHVDHGHCLGVTKGWSTLSVTTMTIRNNLYFALITGPDPFSNVLGRLGTLTGEFVKTTLSECPLSMWEVSAADIGGLTDYLSTAVAKVENTIISGKASFVNWK